MLSLCRRAGCENEEEKKERKEKEECRRRRRIGMPEVLLLKERGQKEDRGARGNPRFISQSVTPGLLLLLLQGLPDLSAFAG